jgi:light-regulated signal transduction histidine kinase (bacteriophytochrome)
MSTQELPTNAPESASAEELERLTRELAQVRSEFQDFVHSVSHDLRAPLRHITAFAQVITEDFTHLPAELNQHLSTIAASAQLLNRQLDGLTQLSRVSQLPVQCESLALGPLVDRALVSLQGDLHIDATLRAHVQSLQWQVRPDLPVVWADATLLHEVLRQVLHNAAKATLHTPQPLVTISSPAAGQLCVQDNGLGFVPGQADRLFKVFGKLHPAQVFEGLGMGLVLCRKKLARVQGQISLTAAPGAGCTLTITLPSA